MSADGEDAGAEEDVGTHIKELCFLSKQNVTMHCIFRNAHHKKLDHANMKCL